MRKKYMLLVGIIVAVIICANPVQQMVRSHNESDGRTEVREKRSRPFPAKHWRDKNRSNRLKVFI